MLDRSGYTAFNPANPEAGGYRVISDWSKTNWSALTKNERRRREGNYRHRRRSTRKEARAVLCCGHGLQRSADREANRSVG